MEKPSKECSFSTDTRTDIKDDKTLLNKTSKHSAFMYISMLNTLRFPNDRLVFDECVTFNDVDHFSDCGEEYLANNIVAN